MNTRFGITLFVGVLLGATGHAQIRPHAQQPPVLIKVRRIPTQTEATGATSASGGLEGFKQCLKSLAQNGFTKFKDATGNDKASVLIQSSATLVKPGETPKVMTDVYTWSTITFGPEREDSTTNFNNLVAENMPTMISQIKDDLKTQFEAALVPIVAGYTYNPDRTEDGVSTKIPQARLTQVQQGCREYFALPNADAYVHERVEKFQQAKNVNDAMRDDFSSHTIEFHRKIK